MVLSDIPEDLATIIADRRPHEPHKVLAAVAAAPNGALLVDRDTFSDDEWREVEGYQALGQFGLGSASALKLANSPGGEQTYASFFAVPGAPAWSQTERDLLTALIGPLRETFERLAIPLLRNERLLLHVFEDQQVGLVVFRPPWEKLESNLRSFNLATRYASSLGISKSRNLFRFFVEELLRRPPSSGDNRRRVKHSEEPCYLEVSEYELRPGVYAVPDARRLLLMREHTSAADPFATPSPRLDELSPALKQIAVLLVTSGQSVKQIAASLGKSVGTVRKQNEKIYKRLGVGSRAELSRLLQGR
jgi:DNA-binding CsgD family transcriptional regulator